MKPNETYYNIFWTSLVLQFCRVSFNWKTVGIWKVQLDFGRCLSWLRRNEHFFRLGMKKLLKLNLVFKLLRENHGRYRATSFCIISFWISTADKKAKWRNKNYLTFGSPDKNRNAIFEGSNLGRLTIFFLLKISRKRIF